MHDGLGTPAIVGSHGTAWPSGHTPSTTLAAWIVHAPSYHVAWHSYLISVVHLRNLPGLPKVVKYDERATHEVGVLALAPEQPPLTPGGPIKYLTPPNYMEQFLAVDDDAAVAHVLRAVVDICNGDLSPDTDFRADWLRRFPFQNPGRRADRLAFAANLAAADGMHRRN